MGIFDALKNEFIQIIEWLDDSSNTLVYRFPVHDQEIKMGAQLTVRENQAAIFVNEGQLADVRGADEVLGDPREQAQGLLRLGEGR